MTSRRLAVLLGLVFLIAVGPIVAGDNAQSASRYSLTGAFADHHSVDLGPYARVLGVDRAIYRGHLRSDKAPGQPLLAVPVYLVGRAFGAQPAAHVHEHADLGLWWQTLWSATIPFAVLLALIFLVCLRFARRSTALAIAVLFGAGTMLLPFSVNLFGHDLAALCGFGAWFLIERAPPTPRHVMFAGFLAGTAVLTEYETAIILVVLAVYLLVVARARVAWFAVGATPPIIVLAAYQWAAFGAPWRTPSGFFAGTINGTTEGGYSSPGLHGAWEVLFGSRGLWIGAPVALVAIAAAVWLIATGRGAARRHAIVGLAIIVPYLVLCAGWSGFALLEDPGPRFLVPALPFLAVPLAFAWDRLRLPAVLFAAWGALIAVPATITFLLLGIGQHAFPELVERVGRGDFLPTVWSMGAGRRGVVLHVVSVAVAVALFARAWRRTPEPVTAPNGRSPVASPAVP